MHTKYCYKILNHKIEALTEIIAVVGYPEVPKKTLSVVTILVVIGTYTLDQHVYNAQFFSFRMPYIFQAT